MSNEQLLSTLKLLASAVKKQVDEGISNRTIEPQDEVYFRWKVEKFQYTDKGVTDYSAHGEYFTKQLWLQSIIKLEEAIKQRTEYTSALECLVNVFGKSNKLSDNLDYFITTLIHQCLENPTTEKANVNSLIATFLKDLHEEPVKYGADVELQGIVLRPESLELSYGITLRQTKVEDLEREVTVHSFMLGRDFLPHPSAIMRIEFLGRGANEIQKRFRKAIAILRLFKVGSVEYISSRMFSESIIDQMASGMLTSGKAGTALETYLVTQEDIQKLKRFWQTMNDSLPESFFWTDATPVDYLTIAYNRYSDALLENGLLERRIANAVMGLEALVLTGETQELSYRLGIRISKLLSLLGHDPHEVKKTINDAYKVRSLFAHSSQLSYKGKKELESAYHDPKNLVLSVLDYLRTLIIVMTLSRKGKDEFIDLVDDSLVDKKREDQLNNIISQAKEVCKVS
jgi:hypothetical protein